MRIPFRTRWSRHRAGTESDLWKKKPPAGMVRLSGWLPAVLSVMAYVLINKLLRLGLKTTEMQHAQMGTMRLRLLKMGAQMRVSERRIWVQLSSSFPLQDLFRQAHAQLRC